MLNISLEASENAKLEIPSLLIVPLGWRFVQILPIIIFSRHPKHSKRVKIFICPPVS
jgi:hypothetical protein